MFHWDISLETETGIAKRQEAECEELEVCKAKLEKEAEEVDKENADLETNERRGWCLELVIFQAGA